MLITLLAAASLLLKDGTKTETLHSDALALLPHISVTVGDHGKMRTYSGVPVSALVMRVGAPGGESLRGESLGLVVVATASDGYRVALSLAETDPGMRKARVIVADAENGQPLAAKDGPLKLVVEDDLRPARAARGLVSLEVKPAF